MMKTNDRLILPNWFWQLLPVLTKRQAVAEFETWLYSQNAESCFPSDIYQELLWINYQDKDIFEPIVRIIFNHKLLENSENELRYILAIFCDVIPNKYDWDIEWWHLLPLSDDYLFEFRQLMMHYFDECSHGDEYYEANQEYIDNLTQLIHDFLENLHQHLVYQSDLPNVPAIPTRQKLFENKSIGLWKRISAFLGGAS